jgi:hypothetical protein
MGTIQTDALEIISQECVSGIEVAAAKQTQLRADERTLRAVTVYNYVTEYNTTHPRKNYKFVSNEEKILYAIGCRFVNS